MSQIEYEFTQLLQIKSTYTGPSQFTTALKPHTTKAPYQILLYYYISAPCQYMYLDKIKMDNI